MLRDIRSEIYHLTQEDELQVDRRQKEYMKRFTYFFLSAGPPLRTSLPPMGMFITCRCMNNRAQQHRSMRKCQKVELSRCRLSTDSAQPAKVISVLLTEA